MEIKKKSSILSPILKKRIKRFTKIKRGYYSFLLIVGLYFLSFFAEFFINGNAIFLKFEDNYYFTAYSTNAFKQHIFSKATLLGKKLSTAKQFAGADNSTIYDLKQKFLVAQEKYNNALKGDDERKRRILERSLDTARNVYNWAEELKNASTEEILTLEKDYEYFKSVKDNVMSHRILKKVFKKEGRGDTLLLPLYSYGPNENLLDELKTQPPTPPSERNWLGTDDRGRDILARMIYGFRLSISFSLMLIVVGYIVGVIVGAIVGYYGGKLDLITMRLIEVWSSMPFLFTVMIISSMLMPNFWLLVILLSLWNWIGTAWYIRAEFLREKNRDYVHAAQAIGVSDSKIIFKHILPNSLTPLISFLPFRIISGIGSLVSLDFLGFGLPEPTPSWGQLLSVGVTNIQAWWIAVSPILAMFFTLLLVTFIGEAVREAFDPKVYSRLR